MANAVEIVNMALAQLGAERILSLTDTDSENARIANIHYEQTVRAVLRSHQWSCVTKRATLARLSAAPAFQFTYQYQLPSDFLRVAYVNDVNALGNRDQWKIEGDKILSNDETLSLVYVYYEEDATQYDELLVDALVSKLAAKMAGAITGDPGASQQFVNEYEKLTSARAQRVDASEEKSDENHPLLTNMSRSPLRMRRAISPLG
jgi:hypothetical protein